MIKRLRCPKVIKIVIFATTFLVMKIYHKTSKNKAKYHEEFEINIHSPKLTLSMFGDIITIYMPRAKAVSDEMKPKRATTSRAPRRVSSSTPTTSTVKRKAPTVIPASSRNFSAKSLIITFSVFVVIMAGSAFVGMADNGQINVSGVIQERGQTLRDEGRTDEANQLTIPKDDGTRQPNGGLRPQTGGSNPPATPATLGAEDSNPLATSTNSSTTLPSTEPATEGNTEPVETEASIDSNTTASST